MVLSFNYFKIYPILNISLTHDIALITRRMLMNSVLTKINQIKSKEDKSKVLIIFLISLY